MDNQASDGGRLVLAEVCKPLHPWMDWATKAVNDYGFARPDSFRGLEEFLEIAKSSRVWPYHSSSNSEFCGECDFAIAQGVRLRLLDRDRDMLISLLCDGYATVVDDQFSPDQQADRAVLSTARERIDEFCHRHHIKRLALWVPNSPGGMRVTNPIPAAAEFEVEPTCRPYPSDMGVELRELIGHPVSLVSGRR